MSTRNEQILPTLTPEDRSPVVNIGAAAPKPAHGAATTVPHESLLLYFIAELRRRRVCRAATMYAVTMWLICQVVELIFPALGLPDWTVKFVIVVGLLCFPVALILSWMIQITPEGVIVDHAARTGHVAHHEDERRRPLDIAVDCGLLLAALVIGMQMTVGIVAVETMASPLPTKIAVLPFQVASDRSAQPLSQGLVAELQHELIARTDIMVIAPRGDYMSDGGVSLTGSVAIGDKEVRVTAMVIDNVTGEVTWSRTFVQPRSDFVAATVQLAQDIVAALPFLAQTGLSPMSRGTGNE
ncbi:MAG: hypothetical protein ACREQ8_10920 [Woeseiaceae bacterium]